MNHFRTAEYICLLFKPKGMKVVVNINPKVAQADLLKMKAPQNHSQLMTKWQQIKSFYLLLGRFILEAGVLEVVSTHGLMFLIRGAQELNGFLDGHGTIVWLITAYSERKNGQELTSQWQCKVFQRLLNSSHNAIKLMHATSPLVTNICQDKVLTWIWCLNRAKSLARKVIK